MISNLYAMIPTLKQAMNHELRTDKASDPSIKNISVASEDMPNGSAADDGGIAILSNLLSSIDAQDDGSGPASTILRGMGIFPPRISIDNDD